MTSLYSVLIPVFNGDGFLARCLDSVLASIGEDSRWQIVCVDDASEDRTAAILNDYAARDPRFTVARHEVNRGSGEARNSAIAHAKGEWLVWVDADDAVSPDWAPTIVRETQADEVDVLCFGARMWRDGQFRAMRYGERPAMVPVGEFLTNIVRDVGSSTWMWNKVFRASLLKDLRFSGRCQEDFHLTPAIFARARQVRVIPDLLYDYFRPAGSLSRHGDRSGSADGLLRCLEEWAPAPAPLPADFDSAWREGCALRAADFLRNAASEPELRRFLRRNGFRVLLDPAQSMRAKVKCLLACVW